MTTRTVALSWKRRAVYLSSDSATPVCCYSGLCLLGSAFYVVVMVSSSGCFRFLRAASSIIPFNCCGRTLLYSALLPTFNPFIYKTKIFSNGSSHHSKGCSKRETQLEMTGHELCDDYLISVENDLHMHSHY